MTINGNKLLHLRRIALPHHRGETFDERGEIVFIVPGGFYPDRQARQFNLPAGEIRTVTEPAGLVHKTAVYASHQICALRGIPAIDNPRIPSRLHRCTG